MSPRLPLEILFSILKVSNSLNFCYVLKDLRSAVIVYEYEEEYEAWSPDAVLWVLEVSPVITTNVDVLESIIYVSDTWDTRKRDVLFRLIAERCGSNSDHDMLELGFAMKLWPVSWKHPSRDSFLKWAKGRPWNEEEDMAAFVNTMEGAPYCICSHCGQPGSSVQTQEPHLCSKCSRTHEVQRLVQYGGPLLQDTAWASLYNLFPLPRGRYSARRSQWFLDQWIKPIYWCLDTQGQWMMVSDVYDTEVEIMTTLSLFRDLLAGHGLDSILEITKLDEHRWSRWEDRPSIACDVCTGRARWPYTHRDMLVTLRFQPPEIILKPQMECENVPFPYADDPSWIYNECFRIDERQTQ